MHLGESECFGHFLPGFPDPKQSPTVEERKSVDCDLTKSMTCTQMYIYIYAYCKTCEYIYIYIHINHTSMNVWIMCVSKSAEGTACLSQESTKDDSLSI